MGVPIPQERGTSSNRYTILGRLASGGMADIYLALVSTEAGVDRYLVLKRVLAERARDPLFLEMFLDEARLAAQLQHPNIAQVYDVGKLEGAYFFTMEYVHGEDVRGLLFKLAKLKKQMPVSLALHIAAGALAALHYAHERTTPDGTPLGVVHRDVSPSNVMVSLDGQIKLLDFGVAKAAQRSTETQSGSIKGKVAYLSPEQCQSTKVDRRTDVYALGIVLWEMLAGRRLYRRETDFATMLAITTEPIPPLAEHRPNLPPEVERLVMTALEKDLSKRYPSAAAMLEDLEGVASAERLILSSTGMGRFMKELFGDKLEPWKDLEKRKASGEEVGEPVTITGESLNKPTTEPTHTERLPVDQDQLKTQLEKAPDLRSAINKLSEEIAAMTPLPQYAPAWGERTPKPPADGESKVLSVEPSDPSVVAAGIGQLTKAAAVETGQPSTARRYVVGALAVGLAGIVGAVIATRGGSERAQPAAAPVTPTAVVVAADANATVVTPAVVAPVDAAVPVEEPLLAKCDRDPMAAPTPCALAECEAGARVKALAFYKRAPKADHKQIEAACKAKGIALVTPKTVTPTGGGGGGGAQKLKDPCKDPAYVEANPLKCE